MGITNQEWGTRIDEVAEGIYRISTPVTDVPGGFSFNQYLLTNDEPVLFHTGPRKLGPLVQEAVSKVIEFRDLRYIGFSHFESDECGSLNNFLRAAPQAVPLCSRTNAMINGDCFNRPARTMVDGDTLTLGRPRLRWFDTPHLPHAWECGHLMEEKTKTLLCGDLLTQPGGNNPPLTSSDILGPSEEFRKQMDYYSHTRNLRSLMAGLISAEPKTLACMHGSAWQGDGAELLSQLADALQE